MPELPEHNKSCQRCAKPDCTIEIRKTINLLADDAIFHTGYIREFWCHNCFALLIDKYEEECEKYS